MMCNVDEFILFYYWFVFSDQPWLNLQGVGLEMVETGVAEQT